MSISQALEVAIGLIFIYYVLGSIVSLATQWMNEALETRGKSLERHLKKIVGEKHVGEFVKLPQLDALRPIRLKNMFSVITSASEPKMIEKIPASTLVDSYFDFVGLTATKEFEANELKELINAFPESEGKQAMLKWVGQGVTNIEDLRKRTTMYFCGVLDQAAATFKSNARSFVIMLSIFLTLVLGIDSIQLAQTLWTNAGLRELAVAKAQAAAQNEQVTEDNIDDLVKQLGDLNIVRIGWWQTELPAVTSGLGGWAMFFLLKVLGLGLTATAISQGSSFWYDVLKKITTPASSSSSSTSSGGGSSSSSSSSASG